MIDTIEAWQCIGCGRVEAPQTCIGVCRDRKVLLVGLADFEQVCAEADVLRARLLDIRSELQRFALAKPHAGRWDAAWEALQTSVRELLAGPAAELPPSAR
jgi:hypothetical protein